MSQGRRPGRAGRRRTTRSSAAYAKGRGLAHWRCHRGLVFLGRSLDPSVGSLYTAAASGRGCGASASADVAGLVDVLPSADAVGRAADTHTVTDRHGRSRRLFRQPFSRLVCGEAAPKSEIPLEVLSDFVGVRRRSSGAGGGGGRGGGGGGQRGGGGEHGQREGCFSMIL